MKNLENGVKTAIGQAKSKFEKHYSVKDEPYRGIELLEENDFRGPTSVKYWM